MADPRNLTTPWRVRCPVHGPVCLTEEDYAFQMSRPNALWSCPIDLKTSQWDDEWFENYQDASSSEDEDDSVCR